MFPTSLPGVCRTGSRPDGAMPDANDDRLIRAVAALEGLTGHPHAHVLLASSGGPDSMALLDRVQRGWRGTVTAATVDHGLRADSAFRSSDPASLTLA